MAPVIPNGPSRRARVRALLTNVLLSLAVTALLAGALEGVCRLTETRAPEPARHKVEEWKAEAPGEHFYTMSTENHGWPPWQEFNRDGLRDRRHAVNKTPGTWRLVFLGDSVTAGIGLEPREAFPQVLQTRYDASGTPVEVFSAALWGWSTRQHRIAYRRIVRKYTPDEVVVAVCLNDIEELERQLVHPPALLVALHAHSALVRRVVRARERETRGVEELVLGRRGFEHFFSEVRALRDEVQADGARFALMVFPYRFQVLPQAPPPAAQEAIGAFCRRENIPFLDLLPDMRDLGAAGFIDHNHLSVPGALRVSDVLLSRDLLTRRTSYRDVLGVDGMKDGDALRKELGAGSVEERRAAAWALGRSRSPAPAVISALVVALRDADPGVVTEAARALGGFGSAARAASAPLLALLDHPRDDVRAQAARSAWDVGLSADQTGALLAKVDDADDYVRHFAVWAAGQLGGAGRDAVPALLAMLDKEDGHEPGPAALSLRRIAATDAAIVPRLAAGLWEAEAKRRAQAALNLGKLGPAASAAVPDLVRALDDRDETVRADAAIALGRIEGAAAVPALVDRLRRDGGWVREEAARALGRIGPAAGTAVPDLMLALSKDDPPVRRQAARALGRIGREAAIAVPALKAALADPEEAVQEEARKALDALAPS
jgi:HEAT repeat protein/lysophospholipase L1-like esterase